jgi:hypothetical protein
LQYSMIGEGVLWEPAASRSASPAEVPLFFRAIRRVAHQQTNHNETHP